MAPANTPTLGRGPKGLVVAMAKGSDLGARGAGWPELASAEVPTYEGVLRALMTGPHFKALQSHETWGGTGEAWSKALIVVLGYKSAAAADEARSAGAKHAWAGLRGALDGASLEETWLTGVWHGAEEVEDDEEEDAAMPAVVANWLKANKLITAAAGAKTQGRAPTRGAVRGAAGQTAVGGNGARADERRDPRGELARVRLLPAPRVDLSESDAPGWCATFFPATPFDRFVANYGHAAFIVAEGSDGLSGLTSEDFANLMARNDKGVAPGYRDALKAERPAGVTVLHGFAARVAGNAKMPLSAGIVAEVAERYFAAFEAMLGASAVAGAADRAGPIFRLGALTKTVQAVRAACATALSNWSADDAATAVLALEATRTEVLRLATELYRCETFVEQLEVNTRVAALVPGAVRTFAEAHVVARAKESKKRPAAAVGEQAPPGKKGKKVCKYGGACRRRIAFAAGGAQPDCPDAH
jgi:hypothetical protein